MSVKITINQELCNQCGKCLSACHSTIFEQVEDQIQVKTGNHCNEAKSCVPSCPSGAITIQRLDQVKPAKNYCDGDCMDGSCELNYSELFNWPVKLRAIDPNASFLQDAHLLLAADCTAFAHGRFHQEMMMDKVLLTTCPHYLSQEEYEHLEQIILQNEIMDIDVVEMDVRCCTTLNKVVEEIVAANGLKTRINHFKLTTDGMIEQ
ncbi:MAG: ATP-binding protein [Erysipelotrichaceae bacterium]